MLVEAPRTKFGCSQAVMLFAALLITLGLSAHQRVVVEASQWPHGPAFSFRFDDGRPNQITVGLPLLQELGVNATFFLVCDWLDHGVEPFYHANEMAPALWREAATAGHELAGHTMYHQCGAGLEHSSLSLMTFQLERCDAKLSALRGGAPVRSFAYPCGITSLGPSLATSFEPLTLARYDFVDTMPNLVRIRGADRQFNNAASEIILGIWIDVGSVPPWHELEAILLAALRARRWVIFGGHGIREENLVPWEINATLIRQLVAFGRAHDVWIDTIEQVGSTLQPYL